MIKQNRVLILTGGRLEDDFIKRCMTNNTFTTIICVDGALETADRLSIPFQYLVGDFDTVSAELLEKYKKLASTGEKKIEIREFQPEKDETDTQIAISLAMEKMPDEVILLGATGTRMDHVFANIHLLKMLLEKGISAFILDENNRIYLKNQSFTVKKSETYGTYFSLIPFEYGIEKVTLTGFKYNTRQVDFLMGSSLGVSNVILGDEGKIQFEHGTFIVMESND
ncbi:MAG: thiamine diphosphokinase [Acetivibrio sp.]